MDGSVDFVFDGNVSVSDQEFIFLHSSFRTSSTWLWSKFRESNNTISFCEIFHEQLQDLSIERATQISNASWRSNHPSAAPYFLEFLPFIREAGGVKDYDGSFANERFLPPEGVYGDLTSCERTYVSSLIRYAHDRALLPVLTCTRSIGRMRALKRAFGGHHILAYRNLFHQWASYSAQSLAGNPYFISTVNNTIRNCRQDRFIRNLDCWFADRKETAFDQKMFSTFILLHLYLYGQAAGSADIRFDTSRAAFDAGYRYGFAADIMERVGVKLDLSDAKGNFELFVTEIESFRAFTDELDQFVKIIIAECDDAVGGAFVRSCYDAMLSELERHHFYTRNLRPFLSVCAPDPVDSAAPADSGGARLAIESDEAAFSVEDAPGARVEPSPGDVTDRAETADGEDSEFLATAAPFASERFARLRMFRRLMRRRPAGEDWA